MKLIKLYILSALMLVTSTAFAQEADTVKVATDSLRNTTKEQPMPVKPVRTLGKGAVIDTLPTANSALSIVLFNDNTWRYILAEDYKNDQRSLITTGTQRISTPTGILSLTLYPRPQQYALLTHWRVITIHILVASPRAMALVAVARIRAWILV